MRSKLTLQLEKWMSKFWKLLALSAGIAVVGGPAIALAEIIVVNNGEVPGYQPNVIKAEDNYQDTEVRTQNLGCNSLVQYPCANPGRYTEVEIVTFGVVARLRAYETSLITVLNGWAGELTVQDESTLEFKGGEVEGDVLASHHSTVEITAGLVGGRIRTTWLDGIEPEVHVGVHAGTVQGNVAVSGHSHADVTGGQLKGALVISQSASAALRGGVVRGLLYVASAPAELTIFGSHFAVDGEPVAAGPLDALTGRLTGRLSEGDPIDTDFARVGDAPGSITLVEDAFEIASGDIVYTDGRAIWLVDPTNGRRIQMADPGVVHTVGVDRNGVISYGAGRRLFRYDPADAPGDFSEVGADRSYNKFEDLYVSPYGDVIYCDGSKIHAVRPSGHSYPMRAPGSCDSVGVTRSGDVFFNFHSALLGFDPFSGSRRSVPGGAGMRNIDDMAVLPNGDIVYTDGREVFEVERPHGKRVRLARAFDSTTVGASADGLVYYNVGSDLYVITKQGSRLLLSPGEGFGFVRDMAVVH
jgi:hypothetical protein